MAETDTHSKTPDLNPISSQEDIPKRKSEFDDPRRTIKNPRLNQDHDMSSQNGENDKITVDNKGKGKLVVVEEEEEQRELDLNPNPNCSPKVLMDKGKGKMIVEEEEEDDSDSDEEACVRGGSDTDDYSDDPLMEVDLNNILPSRTRKFSPPVPGAYLVPDHDDEEEDDDDDVQLDDDDDDDDDGSDDDE